MPLLGAPPPGSLEEQLFRALNLAGANPAADILMAAITALGGTIVIALLVIPLWLLRQREAAFDYVVVLAITVLVTAVLQSVLDRPRPCTALPDYRTVPWGYECPAFGALPSGHASRAFAAAAFLGVRFRWGIGGGALAVASLVGVSRVFLGVHWPFDVVGGGALGIGLVFAYEFGTHRFEAYARLRRRIVEAVPHLPRRAA